MHQVKIDLMYIKVSLSISFFIVKINSGGNATNVVLTKMY